MKSMTFNLFAGLQQIRLRGKIALIMILLVLGSIIAVGIAAIMAQYQALLDDTGKRLTSLAHFAASHINGDDLNAVRSGASVDSEAYIRVQTELRQVIESANKIPISQIAEIIQMQGKSAGRNLKAVYAYTLSMQDGRVVQGADAFSSADHTTYKQPGSPVLDSGIIAYVSQIYSGIPFFASAPYTDDYGTWITGYARVFDSQDNVAGVVCIDASLEFIYRKTWELALQVLLFAAGFIVIVLILSFYFSRRITEPIVQLNRGAGIIGGGDLDYLIKIRTGDEIEDLARSFNQMATQLKLYIENLRVTTAEKERIESELKIAHKIQISMLPRIFPPFPSRPELSIYATIEPAREVGGDLYDFFFIDEHRFCFFIGDVSGKGVPAALFMVIAKSLLRTQALQGSPVDEILFKVNNLLCSDNEEMMFVTLFLGILDTRTGELDFANAGHNPPLLARYSAAFEYMRPRRGFVMAGMENFRFRRETLQLGPADALFLYTDGVTEAMDIDGQQFSDQRLKDVLAELSAVPEKQIIASVRQEIGAFVKQAPQSDDIAMLVIRYNGYNGYNGRS